LASGVKFAPAGGTYEAKGETCAGHGQFAGNRQGHRAEVSRKGSQCSSGAVAAGIGDFSAELAQIADGVLGPSQWEPRVTFPSIVGPTSDSFLGGFHRQFGHAPNYIAAGSFATGLVLTECVSRAASLDDEKLRSTASDLDCNTFYGRFRIDSRTGIQTGHRVLLIRWQGGHKVVLPSRPRAEWMPDRFSIGY
jgi:hypothetical protein